MYFVRAYVYVWGRVDGTAGMPQLSPPAIIKLAASTHHRLKDLAKVSFKTVS